MRLDPGNFLLGHPANKKLCRDRLGSSRFLSRRAGGLEASPPAAPAASAEPISYRSQSFQASKTGGAGELQGLKGLEG